MTSSQSKLINVTLHRTMTRGGDDTWMLLHEDGWRDPYFDYYANALLTTKKKQFNTREKYCRFVAGFVDYLVEAAKLYREVGRQGFLTTEYFHVGQTTADLSGPMLVELIKIYPKVLAGAEHSKDKAVAELARRLGRNVCSKQSQRLHIVAINHYLNMSEDFNQRVHQSGVPEINGLPVYAEASLFPHIYDNAEVSTFERIAMQSRSMIGGVIAGGPRLKRLAALTPEVVDDSDADHYDFDSGFPEEHAPALITSGFELYRDRALYCLLAASGVRISEALALTWHDINFEERRVYIRNPRTKHLEDVYLGYFKLEERKSLPWKGRTHPYTLLIEPFASEFWKLLEIYMRNEMINTDQHPFIFQILKGPRTGHPLILTDHSNLRKDFKSACRKIGVEDVWSPHSLRHMYGVYCLNWWPNSDGTYGLMPEKVQFLMGHSHIESTMNYAKPDTMILEAEQKINAALMLGFSIENKADIRVKVIGQMFDKAVEQAVEYKLKAADRAAAANDMSKAKKLRAEAERWKKLPQIA